MPALPSRSPLPQILCLHGSGCNAEVLRIQTRLIRSQLEHRFEFLFLDGPFPSDPGPGVLPFFEDTAPFYRWTSTSKGQDETMEVREVLHKFLERPGHERIVGLLGFSQGTRVVAGLLKRQQTTTDPTQLQGLHFRFGALFNGGGGGVAGTPMDLLQVEPNKGDDRSRSPGKQLISIPTLHVHGVNDSIYLNGKQYAARHFESGSFKTIDVDAAHHFPQKLKDVISVCTAILDLSEEPAVVCQEVNDEEEWG
ncbi:hypothetical protein MMC22_001142 [Lobaria immixta]|nr:hypothetical protein [Lobaria immixta]